MKNKYDTLPRHPNILKTEHTEGVVAGQVFSVVVVLLAAVFTG